MLDEGYAEESQPVNASGGTGPMFSGREWLLLLVLAAIQFTHIVDFMIIMPLGPVLSVEMTLSTREFGIVVAAYTISAGLANLLASPFLDRFDRKTALIILYTGFTVSTFLCGIAPNFVLLLAARTVAGMFGGVAATVVLTVVGDVFPGARRGTAMGVLMTAFSVASTFGVPLGLWLADLASWHAPFFALGGVGVAVLATATLVLPSVRGHIGQRHERVPMSVVLFNPNHVRAFAFMAALVLTSFMIAPYLPAYLVANVGRSQEDLKYIYLCGGILTFVTLTPIGWLSDRFGKLVMYRVLAVLTMVPILLLTNLWAGAGLWVVLTITTMFTVIVSGRMVPAMAMMTASAEPRLRGSFMSLNTAVQHLFLGVATALGGVVLHQEGAEPITGFALVGLLSCAACASSLVLAGWLRPADDAEPTTAETVVVEGELVESACR